MDAVGKTGTEEPSDADVGGRRTPRGRLVEWVLVDGNRLFLTLWASVGVFGSFLALHALGLAGYVNEDSITRMASGMIAGTFSLVTLVVSVNQLILSQEFSPAGEFRDRFGSVLEFRRDVEGVTDVPAAPADPGRLLELLAVAVRHRANAVADAGADHDDEERRGRITRYARTVADSTGRLDEIADRGDVSSFEALSAAIEYDDDRQLYAARHLRNDVDESSAEVERAFDELIEALRLFGTAQEHLKTIYLQRELTRFSQLTILCGVPATLAAVFIALLYGDVGGATVSATYLPYATSLLATVVFVPLVLLASYILRTATLTRRTAAIGPMRFGAEHEEGSFEVSYGDAE